MHVLLSFIVKHQMAPLLDETVLWNIQKKHAVSNYGFTILRSIVFRNDAVPFNAWLNNNKIGWEIS